MKLRRPAFRLTGTAAIAVGIIAATQTGKANSSFSADTIITLRKTSAALFLALTVVQALQTAFLIWNERKRKSMALPCHPYPI